MRKTADNHVTRQLMELIALLILELPERERRRWMAMLKRVARS